jgi:hypothetical protein
MWRRIQSLAWLIFGVLLPIEAGAQMNQEQLNQLEQTSVQIWLNNGSGMRRFAGSGVLLSKEFVITARHILIDPAARARGELTGGPDPDAAARRIFIDFGDNTNQLKISEVFCVGGDRQIGFQGDGARDICVLAVENPSAENLRRITWFPQPACERVPAGNPRNWNLRFLGWQPQQQRVVRAPSEPKTIRSGRESNDTLTTTFQLIPGNSGGGVVDEQGRLVGLVSAGIGQNHNNLIVALIDPAKELFSERKIDCRIEGAAVSQPEPEMSISFSGRHYRVVDRTSRTPNEASVPISINNVKLNLSFITGSQRWSSDYVELVNSDNSLEARVFGPPLTSRPDTALLEFTRRDSDESPAHRFVTRPSAVRLNDAPQSQRFINVTEPLTIFEAGRFVENKRDEARAWERRAQELIDSRQSLSGLRTLAGGQLSITALSRAFEYRIDKRDWTELRIPVDAARELRNEASSVAKTINPFLAAVIELDQIRLWVKAGEVCRVREDALRLMQQIVDLSNERKNQEENASLSLTVDETPRHTRNQSFLAAIRYPLACAQPVSPENQIKQTEELLNALSRLNKPELLHPLRRQILEEMFPLISRLAPPRSAERFRQASVNDQQLQKIWNDWLSLVSTWCESEIPKGDVVTEWKEIEKTLGMEPRRRNTSACHGSSL